MGGRRAVAGSAVASAIAVLGLACSAIDERVAGDGAAEIPVALDVRVLAWMDELDVPGATVAVTKDSRLVWSKGYGVADRDGDQMLPTHRTRIGSVSKMITAVAAMRLAERGDLDLDGHLYASWVQTFGTPEPGTAVPMVFAPDGVLEDPHVYLKAVVDGVEHLGLPHEASPWFLNYFLPPYLSPDHTYAQNVEMALDWATSIQIRHVMSHTAGFLRNGDIPAAAAMVGKVDNEADVTYPELHRAMLAGRNGPPFEFQAATGRSYSNHGFGLMGQVIAERGGSTYVEFAQANVMHRLGLTDVVPRDLEHTALDASSYARNKDGDVVQPHPSYDEILEEPTISVSTGSWIATARDLAHIMCALDESANANRLLDPATVTEMNTIAFPSAKSDQPLGWDLRSGGELTKDGSTPRGGGARISKFLPGEVADAEINVAIATNVQGSPPRSLLRQIAEIVADADIPEDYDLLTSYPCFLPTFEGSGSGGGTTTPGPTLAPVPTPQPTATLGVPPAQPTPTDPPVRTQPPPVRTPSPTPTPTIIAVPAPEIGRVVVRPDEIWELSSAMSCGPTEALVNVQVSNPTSVDSVEMHWLVGDGSDTVVMDSDGAAGWSASLGPFDTGVVPPTSTSVPVDVSVVATGPGGIDSASATVILGACPPRPQ